MKSILVVAHDRDVAEQIRAGFAGEYDVSAATDNEMALRVLHERPCDFLLIDLDFLRGPAPQHGIKTVLQSYWHVRPTIEIIVMAPLEKVREAVMAVKAGASNYLTYPFDPTEVKYVIESVYELALMESELAYLRDRFWETESLEFIRTKSPAMQEVFEKVRNVAPTKVTVLLIGETGTGKGVIARLIHRHSNRKDEGFVSVHCGAIPDTLLESELFGHEKGAFTGAVRRKLGKFEIAKSGTIFLDEVATLTASAQIKLLQILQDGVFERVGGEHTLTADVRIIAATNMDLEQMSEEGRFRKDLYYRLNAFPIEIPPLRSRVEDIEMIAHNILERLNKLHLKTIRDVEPDVMKALREYSWPGNIRELENVMERAYILESSRTLTRSVFPSELFVEKRGGPRWVVDTSSTLENVRTKAIEDVEASYLRRLLSANRGRIDKTAQAAGITPRHLHALMKKYNLRKETFKKTNGHPDDITRRA
jgi:DNA-binding NtrC family response regulator